MGRQRQMFYSQAGFSFIEVMVAVAIFSVSIVAIFSIFIASVDRINYLNRRLYAMNILENRISEIGTMLRVYKALPFDMTRIDTVDICRRKISFKEHMDIQEVEDYVEVFKLDLSLTWPSDEGDRSLSRSAYISDFQYLDK